MSNDSNRSVLKSQELEYKKSVLNMLVLQSLSAQKTLRVKEIAQYVNNHNLYAYTIGHPYDAVYRMEREGYVTSEKIDKDNERKSMFYTITTSGTEVLRKLKSQYVSLTLGTCNVIGISEAGRK